MALKRLNLGEDPGTDKEAQTTAGFEPRSYYSKRDEAHWESHIHFAPYGHHEDIALDNGFTFNGEDEMALVDVIEGKLRVPVRVWSDSSSQVYVVSDEKGYSCWFFKLNVYDHYGDTRSAQTALFGRSKIPAGYNGFPEGAAVMGIHMPLKPGTGTWGSSEDEAAWYELLSSGNYDVLDAFLGWLLGKLRGTSIRYVACFAEDEAIIKWLCSAGFERITEWEPYKYPFQLAYSERTYKKDCYYLRF